MESGLFNGLQRIQIKNFFPSRFPFLAGPRAEPDSILIILNNIKHRVAQDNVGLYHWRSSAGLPRLALCSWPLGTMRAWPLTSHRPAVNTITQDPSGMIGLITVEKPHRRHGSATERRPPDLVQLPFRGKTKEIRLAPGVAGGCPKARRASPRLCRTRPAMPH